MGRVPARCVVLLEDLDAAFTRSTSRDDFLLDDKDKDKKDGDNADKPAGPHVRRRRDNLSDVNTLSLSGLLNALDGVAAAEGRLLFATTNHLEKLDPALSRPGRMDVWIEFRNATKWQAEALFRNFFPCAEDEPPANFEDDELEALDVKVEVEDGRCADSKSPPSRPSSASIPKPESCIAPPTPMYSLPSPTSSPSPSSLTSGVSSLWSLASTATSRLSSPFGNPESEIVSPTPAVPSTTPSTPSKLRNSSDPAKLFSESAQFGASNTAYRPPPPEENVLNSRHTALPLDKNRLNELAKKFADGIPEEEFSVADLQGCKV
jgi:chaperone BCS1